MVHAANKEKYSSISRIAIAERASLKLIDRLHIPPYLFLSREDEDDVRDIGKHDFRSVLLLYLLLTVLRAFAATETGAQRDRECYLLPALFIILRNVTFRQSHFRLKPAFESFLDALR